MYLKVFLNSEGASVLDLIKIAEEVGFSPFVGDYDFVLDFETPEEYADILKRLHDMLSGTKSLYTVTTRRS